MKKILKNKKLFAVIAIIIIVLVIGIAFAFLNKKENVPSHKEETHNMFVKINPLVKLVFKEEYYLCKNKDGKEEICGEQTNKIIEYVLINDTAKTFYKDLDFKDKDIYQVLLMLCDVARDNNVDFEKVKITTDSNAVTNENILDYLKGNSKYELNYSVYVNFEENINEDNILKGEDKANKLYLVTFDSDGGSKIENQTITKGNKISKPSNPTKNGYQFIEWQLNGKSFDFNTVITEDIILKAKWEKEELNNSNDNNQTNPNNNQTSSESTLGNDENNNSKITSTVDKINLNDNILVTHGGNGSPYDPKKCGSTNYYFATNFQEVFKDYIYCSSYTGNCKNSISGSAEEYPDLFNKLSFDLNKEEQVKKQFATLKVPSGIINWWYNYSNHGFTYAYSDIYIYEAEKYGSFGKTFNSNIDDFKNQISNILSNSYSMSNLSCGDYGNGPELLTEELCKEFNLTCDRW